MKKQFTIGLLVGLCVFVVVAAVQNFQNTNQFGTSGGILSVKSGAYATNISIYGIETNRGMDIIDDLGNPLRVSGLSGVVTIPHSFAANYAEFSSGIKTFGSTNFGELITDTLTVTGGATIAGGLSNALIWGQITLLKPNGAQSNFLASANTDAARGLVLSNVVSKAGNGDVIQIGAGGYTLTTNLVLGAGVSMIGSGAGATTLRPNFTSGQSFICLTNSNHTIQDLSIVGSSASVGLFSSSATTVTNILLRNLSIKSTNGAGDNLAFFLAAHVVQMDVFDCVFECEANSDGQIDLDLGSGSQVRFFGGSATGAAAFGLLQNSGGNVEIYGTIFSGSEYGVSCTGGTMYVGGGTKARGSTADLNEDGGTMTVGEVDYRTYLGTPVFSERLSANLVMVTGANKEPTNALPSTTEINFVDGVTSAIQTQFDSGSLGANARVAVNKNSGATVGTRRRVNFIEGANITLTVADDSGNEEVDVTIASAGGSGATFGGQFASFNGVTNFIGPLTNMIARGTFTNIGGFTNSGSFTNVGYFTNSGTSTFTGGMTNKQGMTWIDNNGVALSITAAESVLLMPALVGGPGGGVLILNGPLRSTVGAGDEDVGLQIGNYDIGFRYDSTPQEIRAMVGAGNLAMAANLTNVVIPNGMTVGGGTPIEGLIVTRKNADQSLDATAVTDDSDFTFSLSANMKATFEIASKFVAGSVGADGLKVTMTNTASTGSYGLWFNNITTASGGLGLSASQTTFGTANTLASADSDTGVFIKGTVVQGGSDGTIKFQWSKNADTGTGITCKSNSVMTVTKFH